MIKRLLIIILAISISSPSWSAIAFDSFETNGGGEGLSSLTFSHTTSGSNRILFVSVIGSVTSDNITGITYAGVSMTLVDKEQVTADRWIYLFYLIGPASGTNNIIISSSPSDSIYPAAASYTGVSQTTPVATNKAVGTIVASLTTAVTTTAANSWVAVATRGTLNTISAGTGSVSRGSDITYVDSGSGPGGAGSYSMTLNSGSAESIGMVMGAFEPVGSGASAVGCTSPFCGVIGE